MATKIYIYTDRDFECPVKSKIYKAVDIRKASVSLTAEPSFYRELAVYRHVATKYRIPEYVGFCNCKRYFVFLDDVPDMEELFKEYDAVAPEPVTFSRSVYEQYSRAHNAEDMDIVKDIVKECYPQYYDSLCETLEGNTMYAGNMFVMRREDYKTLVAYLFDVLDKYLEKVGGDIKGRVEGNMSAYVKSAGIGSSVEYQKGIGGFLGERLTSAFIRQLGKIREIGVR